MRGLVLAYNAADAKDDVGFRRSNYALWMFVIKDVRTLQLGQFGSEPCVSLC